MIWKQVVFLTPRSLGSMVVAAVGCLILVKQLQDAGLISKDIDIGPITKISKINVKRGINTTFSSNTRKLSDLYELFMKLHFNFL